MSVNSGWVPSFDGTMIYFEERGSGLPFIMCNGILCRMTTYWSPITSYLSQRYRAINWDYRGHGRSTLPADLEYCRMEDFCEDLKAVMDHLEIERAVLAGHSLGSQLIFEAWRQLPGRVAGIVSICGPYERPFATFYHTGLFEHLLAPACHIGTLLHQPARMIVRLARYTPLPQLIARSGPAHWLLCPWRVIDDYVDHLAALDYRFAFRALAKLAAHSAKPLLPQIDVPVLIIAGERDPFVPAAVAHTMHGMIRHSELLVVAMGTHTVLVEQPQLVNLRIEMFLREHFSP